MPNRFGLREQGRDAYGEYGNAASEASQMSAASPNIQGDDRPWNMSAELKGKQDWDQRIGQTAEVGGMVLKNASERAMDEQDRQSAQIIQAMRNGSMSPDDAYARINALGNRTDAISQSLANSARIQMRAPTLGAFEGRTNIGNMLNQVQGTNAARLRDWSGQVGDYQRMRIQEQDKANDNYFRLMEHNDSNVRFLAEMALRNKDRDFDQKKFKYEQSQDEIRNKLSQDQNTRNNELFGIEKEAKTLELNQAKEKARREAELEAKYGPGLKPAKDKPFSIKDTEGYYIRKAINDHGVSESMFYGDDGFTDKGNDYIDTLNYLMKNNPDMKEEDAIKEAVKMSGLSKTDSKDAPPFNLKEETEKPAPEYTTKSGNSFTGSFGDGGTFPPAKTKSVNNTGSSKQPDKKPNRSYNNADRNRYYQWALEHPEDPRAKRILESMGGEQ